MTVADEDATATTTASRKRRARAAASSARSDALRRCKAGGTRGCRPQIRLEDPVYDTVSEDEYSALVAKSREQARAFIVDDDGLGYGDERDNEEEEVDWSIDGEADRLKRKKKDSHLKGPSSPLSAAGPMIGARRLASMFTSSVFKKSSDGVSSDSIVDDVIAEVFPDKTDRDLRRMGQRKPSSNSNSNSHSSTGANSGSSRVNCVFSSTVACVDVESIRVVNDDGDIVDCGSERKCGGEAVRENVSVNEGGSVENGRVFGSENGHASWIEQEPTNGDLVEEKVTKGDIEVEEATQAKKEVSFTLNAESKDKEERIPASSAAAGWHQAARGGGGDVNVADSKGSRDASSHHEAVDDGSLPFFMLDAHEEFHGVNKGTLYLFGKVKAGNSYQSCCVVVKNMHRCVYAIPSHPLQYTDGKDVHEKLQPVMTEVAKHLLDMNVSTFSMEPVKRKYAFEQSENDVVQINYPFKDPVLPVNLNGENFCALAGTHCSALELFLIHREIKEGPSWLKVSNFSTCSASQMVSWCKFEVTVDSPNDIRIPKSSEINFEIPRVVATAINLKTIINEKQNVHEIISASIAYCNIAKIDTPMSASELKSHGISTCFTVIRKLDDSKFPPGFSEEVKDRNRNSLKAGSDVICVESSERALLNCLMTELHKLDPDVLVGHNISAFDLEVLLRRSQDCNVLSNMWSKLGRLKRSALPRLDKGSSTFGSGARPVIMSCIAGRLLCDTYSCSRDLLKEVSYSLTELAKTHLEKIRKEVAPHDVPKKFHSAKSLIEFIGYCEMDARLSMELMFRLSILPLTYQLTSISGNLWGKTLQGARAQRVEYLLLHAFHAKKYIVPDKIPNLAKETKLVKCKETHAVEDSNFDMADVDELNYDNDVTHRDLKKSKKAPSYAGGLVLEPKKGLYDKYIILLDFNSLYPSIIQEYNICFTTVERYSDGSIPLLPSSKTTGVLPEVLKHLVERRKVVKLLKHRLERRKGVMSRMKTTATPEILQLDILQQALKLTANSIYGCLGFSNSRFYAKPMAELITLLGREILQSTVDLVQTKFNLEVIYGDTDSIMIYSGLDDIAKAKAMANKVIQEVNQRYQCLEIDLDCLYKRMLLLKKKKYAAIKMQFKGATTVEDPKPEYKGLDIVRRDWSSLAKEVGDFCLRQILSGGSSEDVVESIHRSLMKTLHEASGSAQLLQAGLIAECLGVQEEIRSGQVPLEKYVIRKTLTKPPDAYSDAKNQPHVLVAQRLKQQGYSFGCSVGDTISYVICYGQGCSSGNATGIAQHARHLDELKREQGKWLIDIDYYLSQQILPVISRLCAPIQGISPEKLADCLGLESSKFQHKLSEASSSEPASSLLFSSNDEERYRGCEPLVLSCPSCFHTFDCPPVFKSICLLGSEKSSSFGEESNYDFWHKLRCPKCPEDGVGRILPAMIANQVKRQAEKFVLMYYRGLLMCDDELCKHTTCSINLQLASDSERETVCPSCPLCKGRLHKKYTEADLYKQLSYFCHVLDTTCGIDKMEAKSRMRIEKELMKIRPMVDLAASTAQKIKDRCAYGWLKLQDLVITV